ncbi:MAG: PilZ domain-containing protein [Dissulfurispiraceae bacterium]|jgi:hypothetical protein
MQTDEPRQSTRVHRLFLTSYINREGEVQKTPVSVGRTLNISMIGVGMEVFQEIQAGTRMDLEFDLQGSLLTVQGRVVHVCAEGEGTYTVGVEFDEPQKLLENLRTG